MARFSPSIQLCLSAVEHAALFKKEARGIFSSGFFYFKREMFPAAFFSLLPRAGHTHTQSGGHQMHHPRTIYFMGGFR